MIVYAAYLNDELLCEVNVEARPWLPKPRISRLWLRRFLVEGVRRYFTERRHGSVVKA